jgi:peptide-methionine (R)-S-oxide reductase
MKTLIFSILAVVCMSCQGQTKPATTIATKETPKPQTVIKKDSMKFEITKTPAEWKAQLTEEAYAVLREKGTERPFTGEYDKHFEKGMYVCGGCDNPLFTSDTKFDSHCGWLSFDAAIKGAVIYEKDNSYGMQRVEVQCAKCGGHLGHVFDDGPQETTGMRYCTNSVSIKFISKK